MSRLFDDLVKHLRDIKEDPETGLTAKKMERAYDLRIEDGVLFFKLDRHAAILGAHYIKGLGMSAFSTRTEEYKYDPTSSSISLASSSEPEADIENVSVYGIVEQQLEDYSFDFEFDCDHKQFKIYNAATGFEEYASSLDEALAFVDDLLDEMMIDPEIYPDLELFSENDQKIFLDKLVEAHRDIIKDKIEIAWDYRSGRIEDCD